MSIQTFAKKQETQCCRFLQMFVEITQKTLVVRRVFAKTFEFGAMQKSEHFVDLEKFCNTNI